MVRRDICASEEGIGQYSCSSLKRFGIDRTSELQMDRMSETVRNGSK